MIRQAIEKNRQHTDQKSANSLIERNAGSYLSIMYRKNIFGLLAQLGEHLGHNQDVVGSSPAQTIRMRSGNC